MPEFGQLLSTFIAFGAALAVLLGKDWLKKRLSGDLVTKAECKECQERCRKELEKELDNGDKTFQEIKRDLRDLKRSHTVMALALYQICKSIPNADCSKLEAIVTSLAE